MFGGCVQRFRAAFSRNDRIEIEYSRVPPVEMLGGKIDYGICTSYLVSVRAVTRHCWLVNIRAFEEKVGTGSREEG